MKTISLLWADDDIDKLETYVSVLGEHGFDVITASNTGEAAAKMGCQSFDIILADLRMPDPDGVELLRQAKEMQPDARLIALSSYLYMSEYLDELVSLDFPVEMQDKDLANAYSNDFVKFFIDPLKSEDYKKTVKSVAEQLNDLSTVSATDPFKISFRDFLRMPILEKDKYVDEAGEHAAETLEKAFAQGNIWVLLCGSSEIIRASARTPAEILSDDKIIEFGRRQGRAPYQFSKPMQVDDIWANGCSPSQQLDNYPTVNIQVNGKDYNLHFDSGCPMTLFSYEELLAAGAIPPTSQFALGRRGLEPYRHTKLDIRVTLTDQRTKQTAHIDLTGQAVRDWDKAPFRRPCSPDCRYWVSAGPSGNRVCLRRLALIGRNILVENGLSLILDGKTKKTAIEGILERE